MPKTVKQTIREEYKRLKKAFEKVTRPKETQPQPQWVLQPVQQRRRF